jgi:hypothetical protein
MVYSKLRTSIYRYEIRQLISAVGQLGLVVATFCINILIPGLLMMSLMAVAIIAEKETSIFDRIIYQTVYLVFFFGQVKIQKNAILATTYQHYINDLPVTKWQHRRSNLTLTAMAGNLVLFAPLGLCLFIPDINTAVETAFFIIFALMILLLSQLALYRSNIPWLTLLVMPLAASYLFVSGSNAHLLNIVWFGVLLLEWLFVDKIKWGVDAVRVSYYLMVLIRFALHRPVNFMIRLLGALAIVGSYSYVVDKRPDFAVDMFQLAICVPLALLIGSYQFEIERFRGQYQYYLTDLPISKLKQRGSELLLLLLLALLPLIIYPLFLSFVPWVILVQLLLMLATVLGVIRYGKYYFIAPFVVLAGVIVIIPSSG